MADTKKDPLFEKVQDLLKRVPLEQITKDNPLIAVGVANNREEECFQLLGQQLRLLHYFNSKDFDVSRALKTLIKNYED